MNEWVGDVGLRPAGRWRVMSVAEILVPADAGEDTENQQNEASVNHVANKAFRDGTHTCLLGWVLCEYITACHESVCHWSKHLLTNPVFSDTLSARSFFESINILERVYSR